MLKQIIPTVFVLFSCFVELVDSSIKYGELWIDKLDRNCAINCDQVVLFYWKMNVSEYSQDSKIHPNNFQHMFKTIDQTIMQ